MASLSPFEGCRTISVARSNIGTRAGSWDISMNEKRSDKLHVHNHPLHKGRRKQLVIGPAKCTYMYYSSKVNFVLVKVVFSPSQEIF